MCGQIGHPAEDRGACRADRVPWYAGCSMGVFHGQVLAEGMTLYLYTMLASLLCVDSRQLVRQEGMQGKVCQKALLGY